MPELLYARWEVVKVPFPFTEGAGDKRRPALIVNGKELARAHQLYWLVMITSVVKPTWAGDVIITDLGAAGLPIASIIRTAKIATLQEDRILGRLGRLASPEAAAVEKALKKWLER
jgi:mRNA interferase MazF